MDINNNEKKFIYYSRIVMMIIMTIEFILNFIFIIAIIEVKNNKYEEDCANFKAYNNYFHYLDEELKKENNVFVHHHQGISASFSLFFISYLLFLFEFLAPTLFESYCHSYLELILKDLNHLILLITFFIGQFLYLIDCMIIPVFYQRITKFNYIYYSVYCDKKEIEKIKEKVNNKYILLTVICFVFLLLILFLDFIVLNLYKGICCRMEQICKITQDCCENFGRSFVNKLGYICCKNQKDGGIIKLEDLEHENDRQIHKLTGDIRHLLAENIELTTKDL